jgi:hypothetical protein
VDKTVKFDEDLGGIHFANGRYDLQSQKFTEREPYQYYIPDVLITIMCLFQIKKLGMELWSILNNFCCKLCENPTY